MSSRCSGHPSVSASASAIVAAARSSAGSTGPFKAEPGCSTTQCAPSAVPASSAAISAVSDLPRISGSSEAQLSR